jgi:hypothetical protein
MSCADAGAGATLNAIATPAVVAKASNVLLICASLEQLADIGKRVKPASVPLKFLVEHGTGRLRKFSRTTIFVLVHVSHAQLLQPLSIRADRGGS